MADWGGGAVHRLPGGGPRPPGPVSTLRKVIAGLARQTAIKPAILSSETAMNLEELRAAHPVCVRLW